jgi:hypothetical protein
VGPDLYFDGPARWDPGETNPELVVKVRNRAGAGPAAGPITVSARDTTGEHFGNRPAFPRSPLPGDGTMTFRVVMTTKPPSGTLLTITVSYANEDTDQNASDNAIAFKVP